MPAAALLRRRWLSMLPGRALVSRISRFRRNNNRRRRPGEEIARSEGYVRQLYETDRDRKGSVPSTSERVLFPVAIPASARVTFVNSVLEPSNVSGGSQIPH